MSNRQITSLDKAMMTRMAQLAKRVAVHYGTSSVCLLRDLRTRLT